MSRRGGGADLPLHDHHEVRASMAHGGKDGHPFPVPTPAYDETIRVLKSAVHQAKQYGGKSVGRPPPPRGDR